MENKRTALVVDDDKGLGLLVGKLLIMAGFTEIDFAETGEEALERVNGHKLILMDYQMPGINGAEATKEIITRGYNGKIIGMSGCQRFGQELIEAGCDCYLSKPFMPQDFFNAIGEQ